MEKWALQPWTILMLTGEGAFRGGRGGHHLTVKVCCCRPQLAESGLDQIRLEESLSGANLVAAAVNALLREVG